jgi:thiamine kinase-like enzyme
MDLTTTEGLEAYLQSAGVEYTSVEELSGGTANYVWRVYEKSGRTIVVKHAEPHVKINKAISFPQARMDFEARSLKLITSEIPHDDLIHLPEVYKYDDQQHLLFLQDGGQKTFKEAYSDDSTDVKLYGRRLGIWLARLHESTKTTNLGDNITGRTIYRHSYNNVASAQAKWGLDQSIGERANAEYGSLLQTDDDCVCHGDFWPGNVLLGSEGLTLVDWEMVRRGCGATDIAQFSAESYLLDRFRGEKGLLPEILAGYASVRKGDRRFLQRVAVHFGTHLAFWPSRVPWANEEDTKDVARFGTDIMQKAMDEDWEALANSPLKPLMQD